MKIILGGVRGSCPVAQPEFMTYGGETTSLLVVGEGGERILVDAGTGVRRLGKALLQAGGAPRVWLLMTHYHLDHLAGLPMLPVLHQPDWTVTLAAPARPGATIRDIMARMLDEPFWPLQVEDLKATIRYHELPGQISHEPYHCGGIEVRWCPLHHAGGCSAYRFDEPATGGSLVIATDTEWGLSTPEERAALEALIATPHPARLLIMDGQYRDETIAAHRGWGHSTWQEVVALAERLDVPHTLVTHHDPAADEITVQTIAANPDLIESWIEGLTVRYYSCAGEPENGCLTPALATSTWSGEGFARAIFARLTETGGLLDAIRAGGDPSEDQRRLIASLPGATGAMFVRLAAVSDQAAVTFARAASYQLAIELTAALLRELYTAVSRATDAIDDAYSAQVKALLRASSAANEAELARLQRRHGSVGELLALYGGYLDAIQPQADSIARARLEFARR